MCSVSADVCYILRCIDYNVHRAVYLHNTVVSDSNTVCSYFVDGRRLWEQAVQRGRHTTYSYDQGYLSIG